MLLPAYYLIMTARINLQKEIVMKKFIPVTALALLTTVSVNAQERKPDDQQKDMKQADMMKNCQMHMKDGKMMETMPKDMMGRCQEMMKSGMMKDGMKDMKSGYPTKMDGSNQ
jgi:hypothetical protein